ncbi:MAG TPA: SRPBCC domain-containing protein [Ktedonobacterales bacterium]
MSWQPQGWAKASTVQVRTIPVGEKTVISFHHEGLAGAAEREEMRRHWLSVLDRLQALLAHT